MKNKTKIGKIIFCIIIFNYLNSCTLPPSNVQKVNDLKEMEVTGDVTSVTEEQYPILFGKTWLSVVIKSTFKDGYKQLHLWSQIEQNNEYQYVMEYDNDKNLIKTTVFENGQLSWIILYSYKLNGLLKKETKTNKDGVKEYITYEYDKRGNKIKIKETYSDSKETLVHTFKYNENNELIEEEDFGGEVTKYWYSNGRKVEEQNFFEDGSFTSKVTYIYNEFGYISEENIIYYSGSKTNKKYQYSLDQYNNWIEKVATLDGTIFYRWKRYIEYNKKG